MMFLFFIVVVIAELQINRSVTFWNKRTPRKTKKI